MLVVHHQRGGRNQSANPLRELAHPRIRARVLQHPDGSRGKRARPTTPRHVSDHSRIERVSTASSPSHYDARLGATVAYLLGIFSSGRLLLIRDRRHWTG
jgi:hypothetical protein